MGQKLLVCFLNLLSMDTCFFMLVLSLEERLNTGVDTDFNLLGHARVLKYLCMHVRI